MSNKKPTQTLYELRNKNRQEIIPDSYLNSNDYDDDVSIYSDLHELEKKYDLLSSKVNEYSKKLKNIITKSVESIVIPNDRVYVKNFKNEIIYEVENNVKGNIIKKLKFNKIDDQKTYLSLYPKNNEYMYGIFFMASPADFINIDNITEILYNTIENKYVGTHIQYSKPIIIEKNKMTYENTTKESDIVKNITNYGAFVDLGGIDFRLCFARFFSCIFPCGFSGEFPCVLSGPISRAIFLASVCANFCVNVRVQVLGKMFVQLVVCMAVYKFSCRFS